MDIAILRVSLAVCGVAAFVLGVTVHANREPLAVALVGLGAVLLLVAVLLPWLQSLDANIAGVSLSLKLKESVTGASDAGFQDTPAGDLRGAAPFDSGADLRRIVNGPPLRYLVINLEHGRSWLTSRLYIFVALLREHRGLKTVVFTRAEDGRSVFVGSASASEVIARLERAYPWLPIAYANAAAGQQQPADLGVALMREHPPLQEPDQVFSWFVNSLHPLGQAPDATTRDQFVYLNNVAERARWIDYALLSDVLGASLDGRKIFDSPDALALASAVADQIGAVLVVVTDDDGQFKRVVDRLVLLDQLAVTTAALGRTKRRRSSRA